MPRPPPPSGDQITLALVLLALAVLAALLWINDPHHQPTGRSRVGWPAPAHP
jgi:hypothetical protein